MCSSKVKVLFIASLLMVMGACASSVKNETSQFEFRPIWVQSVLEKPNSVFRKINRASPLVYKDQIIVANSIDGVVSYRVGTHDQVWRLDIPNGIEASGALINDRLFIGGNNGILYSIDLKKGEVLWTFDTKSEVVSEPLLQDGILYFLSGSQSVFAIDAISGKQLWTYNRQDTSNLMTIRGGSKPAIANGSLFVGFSDGALVSLSVRTGTPQWEIILNRNTRFKDIDASPVVDGDFIYINSYDDQLYCLSKNKGELAWKAPYGGVSTPMVSGDQIITTSTKGDLVSLSRKDGTLVWKNKAKNGIFVDPVAYKGMILSAESQGNLSLFDRVTGELKATFEPGRGVFSKPTIVASQDLIYFISGEGNVYGVKVEKKNQSLPYFLR